MQYSAVRGIAIVVFLNTVFLATADFPGSDRYRSIIIAFNIFGSLSMLIIEKKGDIGTFMSMGAPPGMVRRIFVLEGWMISLLGMSCGLVAGIVFALLQQHFGFIKMPGNFIVQAYPVILSWSDILITAAGVAVIGYVIALLPVAAFGRKDEKSLI